MIMSTLGKLYANIRKVLRKCRLVLLKKNIIRYCSKSSDVEIRKIADYLRKNNLSCYNYDYTSKYLNCNVKTAYDADKEMWYILDRNVRVYMKKGWTKEEVEHYWKFLMIEQDEKSPHLYFTKELSNKKYRKVVDLGAAEGNFSLEILGKCEKIYIFECDPGWVEALHATFAPWENKVKIIPLYVSDITKKDAITLDDYFKGEMDNIDLIKIDIEGEELQALKEASDVLHTNPQIKLLICAYHYQKEEKDIRNFLSDWKVKNREGYIVMIDDKKQKKPYLRRGILEAEKCKE